MQKQNWLLAANGSEAIIYQYLAGGTVLEEVGGVGNGTRRLQDQDLVTDRPGVMSGGGSNIQGKDAMTPSVSPAEKAKTDFVKGVIEEIDQARREDKLISLDIVAEPSMLGELRDNMDKNMLKIIDRTVSKDPKGKSPEELLKLLKEA